MTVSPTDTRERPPDRIDPDGRQFWSEQRDHRLTFEQCDACGAVRHPPMPSCPYCGARGHHPLTSTGMGKVYSWVRVWVPFRPEFAVDVPYAVVTVLMDEGCRVFGRLLDDDSAAGIDIGTEVEAVFVDHDDWTECCFVSTGARDDAPDDDESRAS